MAGLRHLLLRGGLPVSVEGCLRIHQQRSASIESSVNAEHLEGTMRPSRESGGSAVSNHAERAQLKIMPR